VTMGYYRLPWVTDIEALVTVRRGPGLRTSRTRQPLTLALSPSDGERQNGRRTKNGYTPSISPTAVELRSRQEMASSPQPSPQGEERERPPSSLKGKA